MDDLAAARVPVLILSGGEPLLRPDIFDISRRAKAMGFYVGLSSNGALIDGDNIGEIAGIGYDYVGISLDGIGATHDRFRGRSGAFEASLGGVRLCLAAGIKVGLRFTMTMDNHAELPALLDLADREGVDKFYLSHLVYAGRGNKNRADDAALEITRAVMEDVFERLGRRRARRGRNSSPATTTPTAFSLPLGPPPVPRSRRAPARQARPVGRQFVGRERRQHRQSRQRAPRYDVVALQPGQREGARLRRHLAGHLRADHGRAEATAANDRRPLRSLPVFRHLRRQHAGLPAFGRPVGRGSGLLPRTRRSAWPLARLVVKPFRGRRHEARRQA